MTDAEKLKLIGLVLTPIMIIGGATLSYALAKYGEPRSLWLWRDILGAPWL